jgi:opacity protein-like surface antigen
MERDQFKDTLKEMAADFTVPVNEQLFSGVLKKQQQAAKQRKKRLMGWFFAAAMIGTLTGAWLLFNHSQPQHNASTMALNKVESANKKDNFSINAQSASAKQEKSIPEKIISQGASSKVKITQPQQPVDNPQPQLASTIHSRVATKNQPFATRKATSTHHINASPTTKATQHTTRTLSNTKEPSLVKSDLALASKEQDEKQEVEQSEKVESAILASQINKDNTNQEKKESLVEPLKDESKPTTTVQTIATDSNVSMPVKSASKPIFGIYAQGVYHPFTSAKNVSSKLPAKFSDTLGLREQARYAYGFDAGFVYQVTPNIALTLGIGYHTVLFDEIRQAFTVPFDSIEFANASASKVFDGMPTFYTTETRLNWLDFPVSVKYSFPTVKKVGYYAQTGFSIQRLITQKGYAIVENPDLSSTFTAVSDHELERFNKTQFAWTVAAGMEYRITKQLHLNAGIHYRQQLNSYYKSSYVNRNPAGFVGFTSGLSFVF